MIGLLIAVGLMVPQDSVDRKIDTMRVTVDFQGVALREVLDFTREVADINVHAGSDVDLDAEVSLSAKDIRLRTLLNLVLRVHDLGATVRERVLFVDDRDTLLRSRMKLRIYDIADLTAALNDFPGPQLQLDTNGPGAVI